MPDTKRPCPECGTVRVVDLKRGVYPCRDCYDARRAARVDAAVADVRAGMSKAAAIRKHHVSDSSMKRRFREIGDPAPLRRWRCTIAGCSNRSAERGGWCPEHAAEIPLHGGRWVVVAGVRRWVEDVAS